MKKFFDEMFIIVFFVFPFVIIYSKFFDYYLTTVVEPKVGMKCGDGKPIESWSYGETIYTPTYDCTTLEIKKDYAAWFAKEAPAYVLSKSEFLREMKEYFIYVMNILTEMFLSILNILKDI